MNSREYEVMSRVEERFFWYRGMRAFARRLLPEVFEGARPLRLLDAGCGTGANLEHVSGAAHRPLGIDLSWQALRFTRARGQTRLANADVTRLPFRDASFDVVTCHDVLYAVEDDERAIRELARVAAEGAIVYVTAAAFPSLAGEHDRAVRAVRRYRRGELEAKLRAAGLTVERATYANTLLAPPIWLARHLRPRARRSEDSTSDFPSLPGFLNAVLAAILKAEAALSSVVPLPFGVTRIVRARKGKGGSLRSNGVRTGPGGARGGRAVPETEAATVVAPPRSRSSQPAFRL